MYQLQIRCWFMHATYWQHQSVGLFNLALPIALQC